MADNDLTPVVHKDRTKTGATRKREEKEPKVGFFASYAPILKKISYPSREKWWATIWRVTLILVVFGLVLFVSDYFLLAGTLKLQTAMSPLGIEWIKIVYSVLIFLTGFIAGTSILLTRGGSEGGLSSMLGSGIQYGDSTGEFSKRISKTVYISSGLLMFLCLMAPLFLGRGF